MFGFFFNQHKTIRRYEQVTQGNMEQFKRFYHGMLAQSIYLAPSAFEAGFISAAHTHADIDATIDAAEKVMKTL